MTDNNYSKLPIPIVLVQYFVTIKTVNGRSMQVRNAPTFVVPDSNLLLFTVSQPTLNPDWSKWRDVVVFDRFSIGSLGQWHREDIVALKYVPAHRSFAPSLILQ